MFKTVDPQKFETLIELNALINSDYSEPRTLLTRILESATALCMGEASSLLLVNPENLLLYRKDGATTWTNAGDVTSSPTGEVSLDAAAGAIEVTSDIQFRFILASASTDYTPVLEHMSVLWLPRPEAVYAYTCSVRLGEPIPLS